jgi:ABC-type polysaccharide/polyol phosphate transport system ATPase subunit
VKSGGFIDQQVKNYSSGMKQRLAFSVAIHANREILLMDEVLAVGDIPFQEKCFAVFRQLKKNGRTIILVTHSMSMVSDFCDRALILDRYRIVNEGEPAKIIKEYERLFEAESHAE